MSQKVQNMRISVSVAIPLYILEMLDKTVGNHNYKSRSDLIVQIIQEKFKLPTR